MEIQEFEGIPPEATLEATLDLAQEVLGSVDRLRVRARLNEFPQGHLCIAKEEEKVVAFKWGYALSPQVFYSWLGGVHAHYRGEGLAKALMERQHHWCLQKGFEAIQTKTLNRFKPMLIFNLKNGFDITGVEESQYGLRILLSKPLA